MNVSDVVDATTHAVPPTWPEPPRADSLILPDASSTDGANPSDRPISTPVNAEPSHEQIQRLVQDVVDARRERVPHLSRLLMHLEGIEPLSSAFDLALEALKANPVQTEAEIAQLLKEAERVAAALRDLLAMKRDVAETRDWFNRDYVNIAVVGRHGSGKSTLLRLITGLKRAEIPTGIGKSLTAVPCKIVFKAQPEPGENADVLGKPLPHAIVEFHTHESLMSEVIEPYCHELGFAEYASRIFTDAPLPPYVGKDLELQRYYRHLQRYKNTYDDYRSYLSAKPLRLSKQSDQDDHWILKFVARYDPTTENPDETDEWQFLDPLAVRSVELYSHFDTLDVKGLRLLDTPGKGELRVDLETVLSETIRQNADIAILLARPDPTRPVVDDQITAPYNIIQVAMGKRSPQQAVVIVVNRADPSVKSPDWKVGDPDGLGNNQFFAEKLRRDIENNGKVAAAVEIVNCVALEEVRALVRTLLRVLYQNLADLDRVYLEDKLQPARDKAMELKNSLIDLARLLTREIGKREAKNVDDNRLNNLFDVVAEALETVLNDLQQRDNNPDKALQAAMRGLAGTLLQGQDSPLIPDVDEIARGAAGSHNNYPGAYGYHERQIRIKLWGEFEKLNASSDNTIQVAKAEMGKALLKATRMEPVYGDDYQQFFMKLAAEFNQANNAPVQAEMENYASMEMSPQNLGLILYYYLPLLRANESSFTEQSAEDVRKRLIQKVAEMGSVISDCAEGKHTQLSPLLAMPNRLAYVRARQFRDIILFSPHALSQWKNLWQAHRDVIWKDEFGKLKAESDLLKALQTPCISLNERITEGDALLALIL